MERSLTAEAAAESSTAERPGPPFGASTAATLLAVAVLLSVGLVRWWSDVAFDEPHWDERAYVEAVRAMEAGGSPYDAPQFVYNPPFAIGLAELAERFGMIPALQIARVLGLLALAGLVWVSIGVTRWSYGQKLIGGVVVVVGSPMVASAMLYGNVSLLFAGLSVVALAVATRRPIPAALALGLAVGAKPMAVPAIATLLGSPRRRARLAGFAAGLVTAATLLIGLRYLPDLLRRAGGLPHLPANISLHRVLYCFGLSISPILLLVATTVAAGWVAWRRGTDPRSLLLIGSSFSLLSVPSATSHTYLLAYPAVFAALDRWLALPAPRHRLTSLTVLLGIVSVHSVHGVGTYGDWPLPVQGGLAAIPVAAPIALAWWAMSASPEDDREAVSARDDDER